MQKGTIVSWVFLGLLYSCKPEVPRTDLPQVVAGVIERLDSFPSGYVAARNVDVWLPEGYDPAGSYPVLYMHDGQMLFDSATTWNGQEWGVDEILTRLIHAGQIEPVIVVGVWNAGPDRHADYFPQKPFEMLPQTFQDSLIREGRRNEGTALFSTPVQSDGYLKFLVQELKPYIDAHYATRPEQEHTFVAGSSMGGLISMYAICEYPEVFGGAACLSTHWIGIFTDENNPIPAAFAGYLAENLPDPATHQLYFDYGTATLDAFYEPHQLAVDSVMAAGGYSASNWMTRKFPGADHSERAWNARFEIPVTFLMGKD